MGSMRLMTPGEAQAQAQSNRAMQARRDKELSDAVSNKRVSLAKLEADFQDLVASQRARWAQEEKDHGEDVTRRETEIRALEAKRTKALIPIENLRSQAQTVLQEVTAEKETWVTKNVECDATQELLEKRLDEVSESKARSDERESLLDRRERGIENQERITSQNALYVSEKMAHLQDSILSFEKDCSWRKAALNEREQAVLKREESLSLRQEELDNKEKNLISRYEQLALTAERIRNNKL